MPTPICFMVMPFRTKDTGAAPPAPGKVDFDALWERALLPLVEGLGYRPVRADQDLGGMIILNMLQRLYFSDLVLADLTVPNGNVYYEVGVRHAMKRSGCVLIGADWSRQLFDLDQISQARYPLPEGEVTEATGTTSVEARLVPQVELPPDFVSEGWKRTGLGRCSAEAGFVLMGKAQGATDAQLRAVLAQDDWLFVEVVDDTWTGPGEKWLVDDHVELWLFPEVPESADPCGRSGKDEGLVQWAIRIADGKVFPAYGDPKPPLSAEVVREPGRARLKVKLPPDLRSVTAVYSDSDAGKKQELLVATSALKFGRAATLSPVRSLSRTEASCQVKGAELAPVPAELKPPAGEAALQD